uniref:Putative ovule protein n=1 Tax=Solanum chacoense TaxID=4108 RepID=A0A0V0H2B1_SOLCH
MDILLLLRREKYFLYFQTGLLPNSLFPNEDYIGGNLKKIPSFPIKICILSIMKFSIHHNDFTDFLSSYFHVAKSRHR